MAKKKTEKSPSGDGYGNTIESEPLTFRAAYLKWEDKCKGISAKEIQSEGRKGTRTVPPNLFEQIQEHVTAAFRRPDSSNDGTKGAYVLIDDIIKALKDDKLFLENERDNLEKFQKSMAVFLKANSKLNPSNIEFNRPESYDVVDGKVVNESEDTVSIYGHYVDAKYPKKRYEVNTKWFNRNKNTSNPPYKQALFGDGDLLGKGEGLLDVIELALKELDEKAIELYTIGIKRASALARLPSVQAWVRRNITKKQFYPSNSGKINLGKISQALLTVEFPIKNDIEQRMVTMAATNKDIEFAQKIERFKVGKISNQVMSTLIREVISRGKTENIKVKNGYYLQLRGLSDPPSETWKEIKKSWMQHLWA